jgi:hypothetical protein
MTKICLVNVGVNSSHGHLKSALFSDGYFEFIPIPDPSINGCPIGVKYSQLHTFNGVSISKLVAKNYYEQCAHNDPEFETYTYGDYPTHYSRVANLKRIGRGDYILFFSRLVPWNKGRFGGKPIFGLIGFFEIENIYRNIVRKPADTEFQEIKRNAHVIRAEGNPIFYDDFWVFKGSEKSTRFKRAVAFDRRLIERCEIKDVKGNEIAWNKFSSDLAAIGSYFRSSRLIENSRQVDLVWDEVKSKVY